MRNWFFGFYILEFEQNGKDHAEYGKALLKKVADEMKSEEIPNANERELRRYRQFYSTYSQAGELIMNNSTFRGLMNPEFISENILMQIRGLPNPEFKIPDAHPLLWFVAHETHFSFFILRVRY